MHTTAPRKGLLVLAAVLAHATGAAEPSSPSPSQDLPDWRSPSWEPFTFGSIERHTRYSTVDAGDDGVWLRAESECSASARIVALDDWDLERTPKLSWRWRVDQGLAIEDERAKAGDDFAARVYVMFRFRPEQASFLERARHRLGAALYELEPPGTALSLVWSSREPEGTIWKNPYSEQAAMVVVASGASRETGTWYEDSVDLVATYRAAFGEAPPPLLALGVMTDADDTCGRASAGFQGFRLSPGDG